jgi:hypothetical protein
MRRAALVCISTQRDRDAPNVGSGDADCYRQVRYHPDVVPDLDRRVGERLAAATRSGLEKEFVDAVELQWIEEAAYDVEHFSRQ